MKIDWKLIETAPLNGTLLLLFFPTGEEGEDQYKIGFWSDGDWYASEASSSSLTAFGGVPSHWATLTAPLT